MFICFLIPSVFEEVRARHLCVFYRQLGAFGAANAAFIGEPDYFRAPAELEAEGRPEWLASWREAYGYEPPASLDGVHVRPLPCDLFAARHRRVQSSWKLYGNMVTRRLPELESAFSNAFDSLASVGPVEAVLTFANNPSVSNVARQRGVPVVHNEFGPLRTPAYVMTGYWDLGGVSRGSDAARRFRAFCRESTLDAVPLLSRAEILHVLRRTPIADAPEAARARYRVGLALQGEENACVHGIGALDLLSFARRHYRRDETVVRYHPAGLARYADTLCATDDSPGATEFIQQCETILTVNSGTALEAVLLGRRAVVVGDSPMSLVAARTFDAAPRRSAAAHLRALNFLVFGYLVPAQLMFDPEYVRWRLTLPSELAIYRYHQRWYHAQLTACAPPEAAAVALSVASKLLHAIPDGDLPRRYAVFGTGAATPGLISQLPRRRFDLVGAFDNDRAKWGQRIAGLTIAPPRYLAKTDVIVSSLTHADAMVDQLRALGYEPAQIVRLR